MPLPSDNDLTFRTTDAAKWGVGKGSPLTKDEVDLNFWTLLTYIAELASNPALPAEIQDITVTNGQMTISLTDSQSFGPFDLPEQAFNWTDVFQPDHDYFRFDLFTASDGAYMVLQEHHSASGDFDPDAGNMSGPYYQLMFPFQNIYDISFFAPGIVGNGLDVGDEMFGIVFARDAFITSDLAAEAVGRFRNDPSGPFVCELQKNGVAIGSLNFDPGASSGSQFFIALDDGDTQFNVNDTFSVMRPDGTDLDTDAKGLKVTFKFKKGTL